MTEKKRNLIVLKTYAIGSGDGQSFGCHSQLPMSDANAVESENAAARIIDAVNAQLDFAGSKVRLVLWDTEKKQYIKVTYAELK